MTAVGHELRVLPELLELMDSRGIYCEVLDGCVVVAPPATFVTRTSRRWACTSVAGDVGPESCFRSVRRSPGDRSGRLVP